LLCVAPVATACDAGDAPAGPPSSTVRASPDLPHARGPIRVRLQPALPILGDEGGCLPAPAEGRVCAPDGTAAYRVLGTTRRVRITDARTRPSADHGAWDAVVRVASADHRRAAAAREQAAGFGGVVLLIGRGSGVLAVLPPDALTSGNVRALGLGKPEAWVFVEALQTLENGV
jgi:hypothetical protein